MLTVGASNAGAAWFLNGISTLQQEQAQTERQISSGYQIQDAADSPSQTPELVNLGSTLAAVQAWQTNLGSVQSEAVSADQALGTAITLIQNAITTGEQGANTSSSTATRQTLAAQIQSIQQQLVSVANTSASGRYIFGGDQDQLPPYAYSSATGVSALTTPASTRIVVDPQGQSVYQSLTAQQIFDPAGAAAPASTFAALQTLVTALNGNDQAGIAGALTSLQSASAYVSQQQSYYGVAEQRIAGEQNTAANQVTALQTSIGAIRDTNVTQAATDLAQETTDQSAAYGAEAAISKKSLFDYLG